MRRTAKETSQAAPAAPEAEIIWGAVGRLLGADGVDLEAQRRAIALASIALSLPCGDKTVLIERLLGLPLPVRNKQPLVTSLVLAGEQVAADMVIDGIRTFLEEAQQKPWMLDQNSRWELDCWLGLLPFTDRPEATVTGVEMVLGLVRHPHRMEEPVKSLGFAPGEVAERTLRELVSRFPAIASDYEWIRAFTRHRSVGAIGMLLDHCSAWLTAQGAMHLGALGREIAELAKELGGLTEELLRRFAMATGSVHEAIEQALAELGGQACVTALARDHAARGVPFGGVLRHAIRNTVLTREPAVEWVGAFEFHPVAVSELRRELFAMLDGTAAEATVAAACLTVIDELRDEYGPANFEPRHPNIETARPWPVVRLADGVDLAPTA